MLAAIFQQLDTWLNHEQREARAHGMRPVAACEFRIVGQTALLEASIDLSLSATVDVDAFTNA